MTHGRHNHTGRVPNVVVCGNMLQEPLMTIHRLVQLNDRIDAIAAARAQRAWTAAIHKLGNSTQADHAERDAYEATRRELRLAYGLPVID